MITWAERRTAEEKRIGRKLTLNELLKLSAKHEMTPEEIQAQRESFVRANMPTGDPRFD